MALCKDKSLNHLNDLGYNVVRLPRKGIEPLDILGRDSGGMQRLGRLDQLWTSAKPFPKKSDPQPAVNINGQSTDELEASFGLKLLKGVLKVFGAGGDVDLSYKNARTLQFTFTNVTSVTSDALEIGSFLSAGTTDTASPFIDRFFIQDDTDGFVISEVIKSDEVTVTAKRENGAAFEASVDDIKGVVGANIGVKKSGTQGRDLTYKGQEPVTFGFKVFAIGMVNGVWQVAGVKPSEELAFDFPGTPADKVLGDRPIVLRRGLMALKS